MRVRGERREREIATSRTTTLLMKHTLSLVSRIVEQGSQAMYQAGGYTVHKAKLYGIHRLNELLCGSTHQLLRDVELFARFDKR